MAKKCYLCEKGNLTKKKVDFTLYGEIVGQFTAEVCSACKEKFFDEKTSDEIDVIAKEKGLWGLEAHTNIGVVGNSLDIRLNKKLVDFLGIKKGSSVTVYPETRKKIIVEIVD